MRIGIICASMIFFSLQTAFADNLPVAPILAQQNGDADVVWDEEGLPPGSEEAMKAAAAAAAVMMTVLTIVSLVMLAISIFLIVSNYMAASAIPQQYQQTNPALVFLFLIPCVNIVMVFIVLPGIAKGFQSYFNAQGRTDVGDCGAGMSIAAAICLLLVGPVGLILWIILTLKWNGYKNEIQGA